MRQAWSIPPVPLVRVTAGTWVQSSPVHHQSVAGTFAVGVPRFCAGRGANWPVASLDTTLHRHLNVEECCRLANDLTGVFKRDITPVTPRRTQWPVRYCPPSRCTLPWNWRLELSFPGTSWMLSTAAAASCCWSPFGSLVTKPASPHDRIE